jgi:hypothetical protein
LVRAAGLALAGALVAAGAGLGAVVTVGTAAAGVAVAGAGAVGFPACGGTGAGVGGVGVVPQADSNSPAGTARSKRRRVMRFRVSGFLMGRLLWVIS